MASLAATAARHIDRPTLVAFGCIVVLLLLGALFEPAFLSPVYLVQQLQIASFLGVVATGVMLVILLGHIDLSIPWTIGIGGMMATGATGFLGPELGVALAIPFGILCGAGVGVINGLGVAYLRAPSMIFTLGMNAVAQGLMVWHTGGFAPQDRATGLMRELTVGHLVPGVPNPLLIWIILGAVTIFMLTRTTLGREIYAIVVCFIISGACAAATGVLLAGWANRSYQAMGDPYLLPTIAAVVLGGTNILGGRGRYIGTVAGVILITILQSMLSVIQPQRFFVPLGLEMPADTFRQVVFGVVIIGMLLIYGREKLVR